MDRARSRWLLRLGIPLVVGVGALVWFAVRGNEVVLTVENHSGQVATVLEIKAGGKTATLRDVAAGAQASAAVPGGPFDVEGQLADGTRIRGHFGQLSGPSGGGPRLVILPGGQIVPRQGDKPPGR
jgi:allophanate hydrolase subunit 2